MPDDLAEDEQEPCTPYLATTADAKGSNRETAVGMTLMQSPASPASRYSPVSPQQHVTVQCTPPPRTSPRPPVSAASPYEFSPLSLQPLSHAEANHGPLTPSKTQHNDLEELRTRPQVLDPLEELHVEAVHHKASTLRRSRVQLDTNVGHSAGTSPRQHSSNSRLTLEAQQPARASAQQLSGAESVLQSPIKDHKSDRLSPNHLPPARPLPQQHSSLQSLHTIRGQLTLAQARQLAEASPLQATGTQDLMDEMVEPGTPWPPRLHAPHVGHVSGEMVPDDHSNDLTDEEAAPEIPRFSAAFRDTACGRLTLAQARELAGTPPLQAAGTQGLMTPWPLMLHAPHDGHTSGGMVPDDDSVDLTDEEAVPEIPRLSALWARAQLLPSSRRSKTAGLPRKDATAEKSSSAGRKKPMMEKHDEAEAFAIAKTELGNMVWV